MSVNPFIPPTLIGRDQELQQVSKILAEDGDLLLTGVQGSGRHTLIRWAARHLGARVLEIDCLRATDGQRFLRLLAESITTVFSSPEDLSLMQRALTAHPLILETGAGTRSQLTWHASSNGEWAIFQSLLSLPQALAETLDCRVVIVFQNFPHIRSWDRTGDWEAYLRQEIERQTRVSYVLLTTVVESWAQDSRLQVLSLAPIADAAIAGWIELAMHHQGLHFDPESQALALFLRDVDGHFGDAIALARRIWLDHHTLYRDQPPAAPLIQAHHVHRSTLALTEDLSLTFESLILLLPPSQVRVLESLALDPTDSPHSRAYIRKHQLSRGGSLQGALASLEQKGLVHGPKYGYRIARPMLAFWLRHRLA